jgi:hypothetical protein
MEQTASASQEIPALQTINFPLSCVQQYARGRTNPDHIPLSFQKRLFHVDLLGDEHKITKTGERDELEKCSMLLYTLNLIM